MGKALVLAGNARLPEWWGPLPTGNVRLPMGNGRLHGGRSTSPVGNGTFFPGSVRNLMGKQRQPAGSVPFPAEIPPCPGSRQPWIQAPVRGTAGRLPVPPAALLHLPGTQTGNPEAEPMPMILRAENLGRVANGKTLVQDATFEARTGEVLAIFGPSGAGKSSLLRLLNRLDEPTGGTVYLHETDYRTLAPRELRRKVGMVTQRPFLFPGSVADNLRFGPAQRGELLPESAVEDLLTQVGLEGYAGRNVANLSGGEMQRVSVARTLANSPLVLLLDEPTSALDDAAKREVESLVRAIVRDQGLGCVMVTHDMDQAARLADRALALADGRIVRAGSIAEVLHA